MAPRIPRIPSPNVDRLPPPVIRYDNPVIEQIPNPVVDIPSFVPPSYEPPNFQPAPQVPVPNTGGASREEVVEEVEEDTRELTEAAERLQGEAPIPRVEVQVPLVGNVPLPYQREVMLAGTTAIGATAAALLGKSFVEWLVKKMKPLAKKIMLKIKEKSGKQFTDYELQLYFELENKVPEQKVAQKKLVKEFKAQKPEQLEAHLQRQRQRKR